tara:strand:+ start:4077 stop:6611 length:2535 start_codon:yes stop_codon:yes gene_type:complete
MPDGLLNGLKVVEYGHYISAPFCARLLADLGASVTKVEDPSGDVARSLGPFPADVPHPEKSGLFLALNTGKRGITLDLDSEQGRDSLLFLLDDADIFVENNAPGRLDELGLGYAALSARNPRLIVISVSPFGLTGPHRDFLATDLITFHMSGYAPGVLGGVDDPASEPPLRAGGHQAEFVTGLTAATATLMAVTMRAETVEGTHVDVSAQEAMVMMAQGAVSNAALVLKSGQSDSGRRPSRRRSDNRPGALVAVLPTRDGYVAISPREERQWAAWLKMIGDPLWGSEERFSTVQLRQKNWPELEPLLTEWTLQHAKEDIYRRAQEAHVPAFPVNTAADLFQSRQLQSRGFFREIDHPVAGRFPYAGLPCALSQSQVEVGSPAPTLGQHNDELLGTPDGRRSMGQDGAGRERPGHDSPGHERPGNDSPGHGSEGQGNGNRGHHSRDRSGTESADDSLPLAGVRVVDFSWVIAGPTCTRILANMGAEVIKVESQRRPDPTRRGGGANFHLLNQSKRSLALNLAAPEGLELAKQLIAVSDVVIENFASGVFERLGLGYDVLKALRPDLIVVSSSGLGHTGPDRDHVAYGTLIQCFTGWSGLTGNAGGRPLPGGVWTDPVTGMFETFLIVSALYSRAQTGVGQYVDFAMAEVICTMLPEALMDFSMNRRKHGPLGNADPMYAPHGLYPCLGDDSWVAIAVTSDEQWRSLCSIVEQPGLADDPKFASLADRKANAEKLNELISLWSHDLSVDEAVERLQARGVPAGPSMNGVDVYNDPHLAAHGFFVSHETNQGEVLRLPGLPWKFRPGPRPKVNPAPDLGQDSFAVLGDILGLAQNEVQRLIDAKVVY